VPSLADTPVGGEGVVTSLPDIPESDAEKPEQPAELQALTQ
jgi:hypothetical protein